MAEAFSILEAAPLRCPVAAAAVALAEAASFSEEEFRPQDLGDLAEEDAELAALPALDENARYGISGRVKFDEARGKRTVEKFRMKLLDPETKVKGLKRTWWRHRLLRRIERQTEYLGAEIKEANGWARGLSAFAVGAAYALAHVVLVALLSSPSYDSAGRAADLGANMGANYVARRNLSDQQRGFAAIEKVRRGERARLSPVALRTIEHIKELEDIYEHS